MRKQSTRSERPIAQSMRDKWCASPIEVDARKDRMTVLERMLMRMRFRRCDPRLRHMMDVMGLAVTRCSARSGSSSTSEVIV
jgi:hypothetical protein